MNIKSYCTTCSLNKDQTILTAMKPAKELSIKIYKMLSTGRLWEKNDKSAWLVG